MIFENIAKQLGFDAIGVAPVALLFEEGERLSRWVGEGKNAGMGYMANHAEKRVDPTLLVEGAQSVIVTLMNYYTDLKQVEGLPRIARYALGKDYHIVVKERLYKLLEFLQHEQPETTGRCFVDSAPVFEHEWARRAGLGWIGKNTLLLNRELGSFCFIGVIITSMKFDTYSIPFADNRCGTCTRCIEACPTGALTPYEVDARKCISYNTIENKGDYPPELKSRAGGRIFGCDACQDCCPWNGKAIQHSVKEFQPTPGLLKMTADDWRQMTPEKFKQQFKNTPLERAGLANIVRNLTL